MGPWTDVGGIGSAEICRGYDNGTPADGATLPGVLLSTSNVAESYEEENPSVANPNGVNIGQRSEWDWVVQDNGAAASTAYYFRMVRSDGTALDSYANYPQVVTTVPTIAWDDFESGGWSGGGGWVGVWQHSGDASITDVGSPYQGIYHLRVRRNTGYAARTVDLSGKTTVKLQFWAKAVAFEPGETASGLISPDGTNWTVVRTWFDSEDDNIYHYWDIDLSTFSMTSQFWVVFKANMSDAGDYFYVDDLKVVSQFEPLPVAAKSDTKGPGELYVDGALISGGIYTLDFMNDSGVALVSSPFSDSGGANKTWVYLQAYEDYLISATAGGDTITAYVRQSPGLTDPQTGQKVYIQSWKEPQLRRRGMFGGKLVWVSGKPRSNLREVESIVLSGKRREVRVLASGTN